MSQTSSWDEAVSRAANARIHVVQFYGADERALARNVGGYLHEGHMRGSALLVVAAEAHRKAFVRDLDRAGTEPDRAMRKNRLVLLDADEMLDRFMVDGNPDEDRFEKSVGSAVHSMLGRSNGEPLRVYGEMVGLLWELGQFGAAVRVERLWNNLQVSMSFDLFCAYPINVFDKEFGLGGIDAVMCSHSRLQSCGLNDELQRAVERVLDDVLGTRAAELRPLMKPNYRPAWGTMPAAEATILWVRNNLPGSADAVLARAKEHYAASFAA